MESKWGLIPDMSGSVTLRELCRLDTIKELAMTGRIISATDAAAAGLVTRVVPEPLVECRKVGHSRFVSEVLLLPTHLPIIPLAYRRDTVAFTGLRGSYEASLPEDARGYE